MNALRCLDLRGLQPPEPMERVLDALDLLAGDAILEVILDREPHPLYRILARNGYTCTARWAPEGCRVSIRRAAA
ncbi:DUF2249 domain-containing protein [Massilia aerilata]|uniref:DUF2249 domain-containing protein n=1 Tax=Massilia aerilata TaxID=453817 RepID=A0ABW0RZQ9_9BURK